MPSKIYKIYYDMLHIQCTSYLKLLSTNAQRECLPGSTTSSMCSRRTTSWLGSRVGRRGGGCSERGSTWQPCWESRYGARADGSMRSCLQSVKLGRRAPACTQQSAASCLGKKNFIVQQSILQIKKEVQVPPRPTFLHNDGMTSSRHQMSNKVFR